MKTYRVTGPHPYLGNAPGSTFEARIPRDQEARAVARGAIVRVVREQPKKRPDADSG